MQIINLIDCIDCLHDNISLLPTDRSQFFDDSNAHLYGLLLKIFMYN